MLIKDSFDQKYSKSIILLNIFTFYNDFFQFEYILKCIYSCGGKAAFFTWLLSMFKTVVAA